MSTKPLDDTEMSMEEILASIRRYVADDGPETNLSGGDYTSGRTAEVIRLTEAIDQSAPQVQRHQAEFIPYVAAPSQDPLYTNNSSSYKEPDPMYDKTRQSYTYETQAPHPNNIGYQQAPVHDDIVSDHATQASATAFSRLADAVKSAKTPPAAPSNSITDGFVAPSTSGSALEGVIVEMVRPMIKQWIDQHLPDMVENLVSKEIEKITTELNKSFGR